MLLGCVFGICWYQLYAHLQLSPLEPMEGAVETAAIRASDYSYETGYGMAVDGTVLIEGKQYRVRAYLDPGEEIAPGTVLIGEYRFRLTTGTEEEATYHPGQGIFLLAYQQGEITQKAGEEGWSDQAARLRRSILEQIQTAFPEDTAPFARALLMGDTGGLTYAVDTDLKLSGIRHVAAVSGLHVSILFALISTVSFRRRYQTVLLGVPALFLFAAISGFTPSVCRASIMSGLMLLSLLFDREYDGPTALAFAVLTMLLINPLVITNVGFQLSVASVAGIYCFGTGLQQYFSGAVGNGKTLAARLIRWGSASVATSLSAMVFTTPLCAWYFGSVSLIGVVTNLLTLWIISFLFYGIMGVCLCGLWFPGGAKLLAAGLSLPIRFVLGTARVLARFPLAAVYTASGYLVLWLLFAYCLLALFLLTRRRNPRLMACCAAVSLFTAVLAGWMEPNPNVVQFTMLDVGQGQCLLLQYQGAHVLVDCGGDKEEEAADIAAETLLSQGIRRLDAVVATHLDRDHAGGLKHLLTRVETDLLILPPVPTDLEEKTDGKVIYASEDLKLTLPHAEIQIFTPKYRGSVNENSLCILFDSEKCDILITGDRSAKGERSLLEQVDLSQVDVLVAGHHGSADASSGELLRAVSPEIVCISVGKDNPYGQPAPEVLKRLQNFGCQVYRTDLQGTITIRR